MKPLVRRFNRKGITRFRISLDEIRSGLEGDLPSDLVMNENLTELIKPEIELKSDEYGNKYEMAENLHESLVLGNPIKNIWVDVGLWSWLSAFLFDLVCPEIDGVRHPGIDARHILEVSRIGGGWPLFYRHLIACPVRLCDFLGEKARILLAPEFHQLGDMTEQFASRRKWAGNRTAIGVLNRLYYDKESGKQKRGAQTRTRPGNHRRYLSVLEQLDLTYDINSMTEEQLVSLLPGEFDSWLTK